MGEATKRCSRCKQYYPPTTKHWHCCKTYKDGFAVRCKNCCRESQHIGYARRNKPSALAIAHSCVAIARDFAANVESTTVALNGEFDRDLRVSISTANAIAGLLQKHVDKHYPAAADAGKAATE